LNDDDVSGEVRSVSCFIASYQSRLPAYYIFQALDINPTTMETFFIVHPKRDFSAFLGCDREGINADFNYRSPAFTA
jgi:hypothetical protein